MKAILTDEQTLVYGSMEDQSISITTIHKGEEMNLGKVNRKKGKVWVEITLPGNQKGYITGETKIFTIRKAQLAANSVDMVDAPSKTANVIKTLTRGTQVTVAMVEKTEEGTWFKVRDESNVEGYVPTSTKFRVMPEYTRSSAMRNILTGLVFVVIGVALTMMNSSATQGSSMIYVSYAVVFFGLLQLGQGVIEYIRVTRAKDKPKA